MKNSELSKSRRSLYGWVAVIAGIVLFITGITIRSFIPGTLADTRLLEGLGILITGWGIIPLVRSISIMRNPVAAHRDQLTETDERAITLRNQAAYYTFLFSLVTTSILLVIYSALTRGQSGFDPIWFSLAFLVIAPVMVFAGLVSWLNRS